MKNLPAGVCIVIIAVVLGFASCVMNGVSIYNRNHPPKSAEEKKQEEWDTLYKELTENPGRLKTGRVLSVSDDLYEVVTGYYYCQQVYYMKAGYNIKPKVGSRVIYYDGSGYASKSSDLILKVIEEQTPKE